MNLLYPTSLEGIEKWAMENHMRVGEAELRYAQFGVLQSLADSSILRENLAFKGGNALDFVWAPNRSTIDLDFSCSDQSINESILNQNLGRSLAATSRRTGVAYRIQALKRKPPGETASFPSLEVGIGYALPADTANAARIARAEPSTFKVKVDISLNEVICETYACDVGRPNPLSICSPEDIVAEKLRALLQQSIRNRRRGQDVLDICVCLRTHPKLNFSSIREFLIQKASSRSIAVSHESFLREDLREFAREDYDGYQQTTRTTFVQFDEAFEVMLNLVAQLELPKSQSA